MEESPSMKWLSVSILLLGAPPVAPAGTVALWLFDEPAQIYPSSALNDASGHNHFLVIGRGGRIAEGHFGRALEPVEPTPLQISGSSRNPQFGLTPVPAPTGRKVAPMTRQN